MTPVAVQLRTAGERLAIPRRIHGVRLAITSTARSVRRIAVRGPGVGVDASSASADPARGPWRSTASSCQVPGTPRNSTLPRSSKPVPEPTTRSRTVRETRMSPAPAWPRIRAAMWLQYLRRHRPPTQSDDRGLGQPGPDRRWSGSGHAHRQRSDRRDVRVIDSDTHPLVLILDDQMLAVGTPDAAILRALVYENAKLDPHDRVTID